MPAKTVTVYVCDRCGAEQSSDSQEVWDAVRIPTEVPSTAGQVLCPDCVMEAKRWMLRLPATDLAVE